MENLTRIQIGDCSYPIKMDLNVLEQIQEGYGSINQFEMDLLGIEFIKDEEGHQLINGDGKPLLYRKEPSVKAIRAALCPMINEGLEIEAEQTGQTWQPVTKEDIERECTVDYMYLSNVIHEEFKRCFAIKKNKPEKPAKKAKDR